MIRRVQLASALATASALAVLAAAPAAQQPKQRLNRVIEAIEQGKHATASQDFETFGADTGEWLFIDMEHGPFDFERLETVMSNLLYGATGRPKLTPIVRIPMEGDEDFRWAVKQVLDMGGFGIVFPHIETREQALKAVQAMRYPPQRGDRYPEPRGLRGNGPGWAARYWGLPVPQYVRRADVWPLNPDGELLAMVMIETPLGAKNIKEILAVPGVVPFVGPGDMSLAMGVRDNPSEVEPVVQEIADACRASKVHCGIGGNFTGDMLKKRLAQGYKFLGASIDLVNELGRIPAVRR